MKVLVACEFSGVVRDAFIARGHDAMSCDLLPTDIPGPHFQGDVIEILDDRWDLLIAHPPCTYLTCSAEWAYKDVQTKRIKPGTLIGAERRKAREEAVDFFMRFANAPIKKICIENPVGVMSTRWRKPDQIIQPYEFGHDASKKTCLWLKNLAPLVPTAYVKPRLICSSCGRVLTFDYYACPDCRYEGRLLPRWANQTDSGQNRLPPSKDRGHIRSVTYTGIAKAMAEQWG